MNCQQFIFELEELVVDGPEVTLSPEMHRHQLSCPECRLQYRVWQDAWMMLPAALEPAAIPSHLESDLMARMESEQQARPLQESLTFVIWKYILAASVLFALAAGTLIVPNWLRSNAQSQEELAQIREFARQMRRLETLESVLSDPRVSYVSLNTTGNTPRVQGYLVYDFVSSEGHFFGRELEPAEGRTYVLWLLDKDQRVVSSSTISVDDQRLGATVIALPDDASPLHQAVVSQETDATASAPSGEIRMRSRIGLP